MSALNLLPGCTIWIPIGVWIFALVNWAIVGDLDGLSAFAGICTACLLGFMTFRPPVPGMAPYTFGTVMLTVVVYPFARAGMNKKQMSGIEIAGIQQGYDLLGQRPNNPFGKLKIAQHLYNLGHHGHAIAIASSVMPQLPEKVFLDEHRMVRLWKASPPRASAYNPISCVECGHSNPPGQVFCFKCGEPFLLHVAQGKFLPNRTGPKLVAIWTSLVALVAGIPFASTLPMALCTVVVCTLLFLCAGLIYLAFRKRPGASS